MVYRTDLALETFNVDKKIPGIEFDYKKTGKINIKKISITTSKAAKIIKKQIGKYITIEMPNLTNYFKNPETQSKIIAQELEDLIPQSGLVFIVGLGNSTITSDSLGPRAAQNIFATRSIKKEILKSTGLSNLREVAVLSPGVLGQTGIESAELITSLVKSLNPSCVVIIDALASRNLSMIGRTIQISNTGICPGSGIGNIRPLINSDTLGVPAISIGMPTVVDANSLIQDALLNLGIHNKSFKNYKHLYTPKMIVTPREVDILIERAAAIISMGINCALHPQFSPAEIKILTS